MTQHTHVLAKEHGIIDDDGNRVKAPAGTPVSPTEAQLKNMPDVFLGTDGHAVDSVSEEHGMRGKSITSIKDEVAEITDFAVLEAMMAEEEAVRDRKGAKTAIAARIEFLTAEAEEAADQ
jgi:hypothetical protein